MTFTFTFEPRFLKIFENTRKIKLLVIDDYTLNRVEKGDSECLSILV